MSFTEGNKKFCLSLHYNADNSYFLMEKIFLNLKLAIKNLTFYLTFASQVFRCA